MERRQKDITLMAEHAGLTAVKADRRNARIYLLCAAENGVEREFSVSTGTRSDPRGDLNQLSLMKRFGRENAAPRAPEAAPAPAAPITIRPTLTMKKTAAPQPSPSIDISPLAFYRLCEWLKAENMAALPNFEALALAAARHIGHPVEHETIQQAMQATSIAQPDHWNDPTDPVQILTREVAMLMKNLGAAQSPAFVKLAGQLQKATA